MTACEVLAEIHARSQAVDRRLLASARLQFIMEVPHCVISRIICKFSTIVLDCLDVFQI